MTLERHELAGLGAAGEHIAGVAQQPLFERSANAGHAAFDQVRLAGFIFILQVP